MHGARRAHSATVLTDGRVLVTGGFGPFDDASLAGTELYDPVSDTWSPAASPERRYAHTATLLANGEVLITGGIADYDVGSISRAEVSDPDTDTWSPNRRRDGSAGDGVREHA